MFFACLCLFHNNMWQNLENVFLFPHMLYNTDFNIDPLRKFTVSPAQYLHNILSSSFKPKNVVYNSVCCFPPLVCTVPPVEIQFASANELAERCFGFKLKDRTLTAAVSVDSLPLKDLDTLFKAEKRLCCC